MFKEMKEVLSNVGLTPEGREAVKEIGVSLRQLENEGKDSSKLDECTYVLTLGYDWLGKLEVAGVPDQHPLVVSVREYMKEFLPAYTQASKVVAESKMGFEI